MLLPSLFRFGELVLDLVPVAGEYVSPGVDDVALLLFPVYTVPTLPGEDVFVIVVAVVVAAVSGHVRCCCVVSAGAAPAVSRLSHLRLPKADQLIGCCSNFYTGIPAGTISVGVSCPTR